MSQKNYYQLLHVSPQATAQEIKAAYRKLAFKYHPDRNKGNTLTEAVLKEINEAYSVLSHPEKRKFYNAAIAISNYSKHRRPAAVTSHTILQDAVKLKTFVEKSNVLSINQDAVFYKIQVLLSDYHLNILLLENNKPLIHEFVRYVIICMQPLTYKRIQKFFVPLNKLAAANEAIPKEIQILYQDKKAAAFWQRYKMVAVLIIAILLCLLIYVL